MAFTKFASFEGVQVLDVKGSQERVKTASLDKLADFADFRTSAGYLYARIRAISSRINKNWDGWPSVELAGGQDQFDRIASLAKTSAFTATAAPDAKYGYSTFLGKPVFVDHHNSDPSRARGVIVDARLHVEDHKTASELDPYYAGSDVDPSHLPPTWVELLLEIDAKSFPKLAQAIIEGSQDPRKGIDGFSMGADVGYTKCSICDNKATSPDEYCNHVRLKGAHFTVKDPETGRKVSRRAYENCFKCAYFELSCVFDPADETALLRELIQKEGSQRTAFPSPYEPNYEAHDPDEVFQFDDEGRFIDPATGQLQAREYLSDPDLIHHHGLSENEHGALMGLDQDIQAGNVHPATSSLDLTPRELAREYGVDETPQFEIGSNPEFEQMMGLDDVRNLPETEHPLGPQYGRTAANQQHNDRDPVATKFSKEMLAAMTARDFRMLADMIATSPVENRQALAEHAANYLAQTNPAFDQERFIQAALGTPQTGRDQLGGGSSDYAAPDIPLGHQLPGITTGKVAQNPPPQSTLLALPEEVDTLRNEEVCPVCGSTMGDETCEVCGYVEPPEGFDNPDLTKAQEDREGPEESEGPEKGQEFQDQAQQAQPDTTSNPLMTAKVRNDMSWDVRAPSRVAALEKDVIVPNKGPATDESVDQEVIADPKQPVTSSVRTAEQFIAVAGANDPRRQMSTHTADAASGAPAVANPDVNVDVDGVGGVDEASNEEASKADAQVDTTGVGGTGVEDVGAESTVSVDQGDEHSKNIESIPTKTWSGTDGSEVETQREPVSPQPFPASEDGVKASRWQVTALESQPFPRPEDAPYSEGEAAVQGVQPVDPVGLPDERVNLFEPTTSPENNSGPTSTWSGTDGNGVLRQQEPTTGESLEGADGVTKSTHLITAMRLADLEIKLGMLEEAEKYQRVGELEEKPFGEVRASLNYAEKVRTAAQSGKLSGTSKTSRRLPIMSRQASPQVEETEEVKIEDLPTEVLFLK